MKKAFFFPWRTYLTFFYLCLIIFILAGIAFRAFFPFEAEGHTFGLVIFLFAATTASSLVFFLPLRTVLLKAVRLSNKSRVWGLIRDEEKLFHSQVGVFREFDVALNLIRKKMKRRRIQLGHEREEAETIGTFLEDALVRFSPTGEIKYFNSQFAHLFFAPGEWSRDRLEDTTLNVRDVIGDKNLLGFFDGVFREKQLLRTQYFRDAEERAFSVLVSPLRDDRTREVYGAIALFHDISDLKRVERLRMEFVENASHELRTPLTSIKGFLATVQEDFQENRLAQIPQFLGIIAKSVVRLEELVQDMLTLSKLENPSGLVKLSVIQTKILTTEVIESLAPLANEKNIAIKYISTVEKFMADEEKVERILLNLVGNSIKYIPEHGLIEISWQLTADRKMIELRVHDDGPGIPEEHLGRLFERFYRIDKGRSREVGGTGLGLSIVKHIMQIHGGRVHAESMPGEGLTFVCQFPNR